MRLVDDSALFTGRRPSSARAESATLAWTAVIFVPVVFFSALQNRMVATFTKTSFRASPNTRYMGLYINVANPTEHLETMGLLCALACVTDQ